jgi:hypothetical protein
MDPLKWRLKYRGGGDQYSNLDPYDQVVKVGEGWVGRFGASALYHWLGCQMIKYPI